MMVLALVVLACEKPEKPDTEKKERVVVYTVEQLETRKTLTTEAEWNALLEQLCDHARAGSEVTFFNLNQTTYVKDTKGGWGTKSAKSFTTSHRAEMITWMKEMEKMGLTVRVTYNDGDGTWRGVAYATAPSQLTAETILGTWHLNCVVVSKIGNEGNLLDGDMYEPDHNGAMYYTFNDDGSMVLTINGLGGTSATDTASWTLTDDGKLHSELLPNGKCWDVNWITSNAMVFSCAEYGTNEGDRFTQLQFDRQ